MNVVKLRIEGVRKSYGTVAALHNTSLAVNAGEFLTLLGPSGSGKTTLLHCVAGLIDPDEGSIEIDGINTTHLAPNKRDIGMVFQNYALFPHLSIRENVAFPLEMRRISKTEITDRVRRALELVRLSHVEDRFPRQLSGGQQQRVALARCVVYEPAIILMDEPLGALDKKLREQMQWEIRRIHNELGATIVYVTHDQDEAMTMSDRICLMRDGRIEQLASPYDLYHTPCSVYAADFLGESNLLKARKIDEGKYTVTEVESAFELQGMNAQNIPIGTEGWCLFRPESIHMLNDAETATNAFDAVVQDATLIGGIIRYRLRSDAGFEMCLNALSSGPDAGIVRGTNVRVGIDGKELKFLQS